MLFKFYLPFLFSCLLWSEMGLGQSLACEETFWSIQVEVVKSELMEALNNPESVLDSLEINPNALEAQKKLGKGYSGQVFLAEYNGQKGALKLFEEYAPQSEFTEAVIIQMYLAKLSIAPEVFGYLRKDSLRRWIEIWGEERINSLPEERPILGSVNVPKESPAAFIMGLSYGTSLKFNGPMNLTFTESKFNLLMSDVRYIEYVFRSLNICRADFDAYIHKDGHLTLIDIGGYRVGCQSEGNWLGAMIKKLVEENKIRIKK